MSWFQRANLHAAVVKKKLVLLFREGMRAVFLTLYASLQELISEVPPIPVNGARIGCDGGKKKNFAFTHGHEANRLCMHQYVRLRSFMQTHSYEFGQCTA
jgi:hypothetical protein